MKISDSYIFCKGYLAGYRDGLRDGVSGKMENPDIHTVRSLPVRAMGLSTRAYNCLTAMECETVADVAAISRETIVATRNMGPKTASEIAHCLTEHGVFCSAWTEYL